MEFGGMINEIEDFIVEQNVPDGGIIFISEEWYKVLKEEAPVIQRNKACDPCLIYEGRGIKSDNSLNGNEMRYDK